MISNSCSLSYPNSFSLTHVLQLSVSECVINREAHSLFILFHSLNVHFNMSTPLNNYLLGPTSLGESNNPSAPQIWGLCLQSTRVNLDTIMGTIAPADNGGLTSMTLHDLFTYWISRSKHWGMAWLNYIIDTSWNKHQGTIQKIYKWIHSEVTNTSTQRMSLGLPQGYFAWILQQSFIFFRVPHVLGVWFLPFSTLKWAEIM